MSLISGMSQERIPPLAAFATLLAICQCIEGLRYKNSRLEIVISRFVQAGLRVSNPLPPSCMCQRERSPTTSKGVPYGLFPACFLTEKDGERDLTTTRITKIAPTDETAKMGAARVCDLGMKEKRYTTA